MKTIIITPEIEEAVSSLKNNDEIAAFFLALMLRASDCVVNAQDTAQGKRKRGGQPGNRNACRKTNTETNQTIEEKAKERETEKEKYQKNKDKDKEKEKEGFIFLEREDNTAQRFVPPQLEEIKDFILERNYQIDPEVFYQHYEANGWHIGRARMKNWRAAAAQWNAREKHKTRHYADAQRPFATGTRTNRRPTIAELTVESATQAIANLQQRRESPLAEVFGW